MTSRRIRHDTLKYVLEKMLRVGVAGAHYRTRRMHGGTLGDVRLVTGQAETLDGRTVPYKLVLKIQKQWERYGDPGSWRREYDLYVSGFGKLFQPSLRWPECYHAEMRGNEWQIWMEYIQGVSGLALTGDMFINAAYELGRFQGRLYAQKPDILNRIANLSREDAAQKYYTYYRSSVRLYDYVRSEDCGIPRHLCAMLIDADERADSLFKSVEALPVIFCHRDFWVTNIFDLNGQIILIDWDTSGWGYLGEDLVSLIADEADVEHMTEYFDTCVPAYLRGFSEYVRSDIPDLHIRERIILHFGYRLVEWYLDAETEDRKKLQINTLQQIYRMGS